MATNAYFPVAGNLEDVAISFLPAAPGPTSAAYVLGGTVTKSLYNRLPPRQVGTEIGTPSAGDCYLRLGPLGVADLNVSDPGGDWAVMLAVRAPNVDTTAERTLRLINNYDAATGGLYLHATVGPAVGNRRLSFLVSNAGGAGSDDVTVTLANIPDLKAGWLCLYAEAVSGVRARIRNLTSGTASTVATTTVRPSAGSTFQVGKGPGNTLDSTIREFDMAGLTLFSAIPTEDEIQASYARIKGRLGRFGHSV